MERQDELSLVEWKQWLRLCNTLRRLGAVTAQDISVATELTKPVSPGQQLLEDLYTWGKTMERMGFETRQDLTREATK